MPVTQELKVHLQRVIFKGALRGAHRYSRSVNPYKIPFFLLGGDSCRRYEALTWRERIIFQALQKRWGAKIGDWRQGDPADTNDLS